MSASFLEQVDKTANLSKRNQLSLMIFQVSFPNENLENPAFYGMNVFKVREVLEARAYPLSEMPNTNSLIEGMIELRGVYLPVINLPKWMGYDMTEEERSKSIIIVADFSRNFIGLRVSHIHGVEEKEWTSIHPAGNYNLDSNGNKIVNHTYLEGSDTLCYILDIEKLLIEAMPSMASKILESAEAIDTQTVAISNQLQGKLILYAEDSKSIQKYMNSVFDKLGLTYLGFDNGKLMLDYIRALDDINEIGIIFTDLEMPMASGHTVIKELRGQPRFNNTPIIVHTSMTSENNSREVLEMGANYFVGKVDTDLIIRTLMQIQEDYPHLK